MIKKTFATLRKNPIIVAMILTVVTLKVAIQYSELDIYLIPFAVIDWVYNNFVNTDLVRLVYEIPNYLFLGVVTVFAAAPSLYYLYLSAEDKNIEGFYLKGLKRCWWKVLLLWTVIVLVKNIFAELILINIMFESNMGYEIYFALLYILSTAVIWFALLLAVPLIAEKKFAQGIRNIFSAGKGYLWGSLAVSIIIVISENKFPYNFGYDNVAWQTDVLLILLQVTLATVLIMYGMHIYPKKQKQEEQETKRNKPTGERKNMIRKTIKTLKDNPILFVWFLIPFAYSAISIFLVNQGILSPDRVVDAMRNIGIDGWNVGITEYITWTINTLYFVGWTFLLYPPLIYLVCKIVDKQSNEGWYAKGLKHGWWRIPVFSLMAGLAAGVAGIPIGIIAVIAGIASAGDILTMQLVMMFIIIPLMAVFMIYMQSGIVSVIAEKDFGKGLGMTFKVGTKHFFRILLVSILSLIPMVSTFVISFINPDLIGDTYILISSLWGCIASPIITVFIMHCYIDIRDKEIEKKALLEELAEEREIKQEA